MTVIWTRLRIFIFKLPPRIVHKKSSIGITQNDIKWKIRKNRTVRWTLPVSVEDFIANISPQLDSPWMRRPFTLASLLYTIIAPSLSFAVRFHSPFSLFRFLFSRISRPSSTTSRKPCQSIIDPPQPDLREAKAEPPPTQRYSSTRSYFFFFFYTDSVYIIHQ